MASIDNYYMTEDQFRLAKETLSKHSVNESDADSAFDIAYDYHLGQNGKERNYTIAAALFAFVANRHDYVIASYNLGVCYESGNGVEQNWKRAFALYQKAVDKGHDKALSALGQCYEYGNGVPKDMKMAVILYEKGVEKNVHHAMYRLGECYRFGNGVEKDYQRAVELYQRAANLDDAHAISSLGCCYKIGNGVEKDC